VELKDAGLRRQARGNRERHGQREGHQTDRYPRHQVREELGSAEVPEAQNGLWLQRTQLRTPLILADASHGDQQGSILTTSGLYDVECTGEAFMRKNLTLTSWTILFLTAAVVHAQDLPTVDQVLDKYVQALGGKENIEKITSRVSKGIYAIPEWETKGPHEIYAKAPNKFMSATNMPDWGVLRQGYNGSAGWAGDPDSGIRDLSGGELDEIKRTAELHSAIKLKAMYTGMTVTGKQQHGENEAYVVEAKQPGGLTEKFFFDAQSGLLVRRDSPAQTPEGRITTVWLYADYRDVGGVKVPFTIEQNNPNMAAVITLEKVEHNVPVDDKLFEKPAGQ
jgi:hypothetical protein